MPISELPERRATSPKSRQCTFVATSRKFTQAARTRQENSPSFPVHLIGAEADSASGSRNAANVRLQFTGKVRREESFVSRHSENLESCRRIGAGAPLPTVQ